MTKIEVRMRSGCRVRVPGYRFGAFAAHEPVDSVKIGTVVTHLPTGFALPPHVVGDDLDVGEATAIAKHLNKRWGKATITNPLDPHSPDRWIFEALAGEAFDPEVAP